MYANDENQSISKLGEESSRNNWPRPPGGFLDLGYVQEKER